MHVRNGSEIDAMREDADNIRQRLADELLRSRLSMQARASSTPDGGLEE
jgi:hypothetical protein